MPIPQRPRSAPPAQAAGPHGPGPIRGGDRHASAHPPGTARRRPSLLPSSIWARFLVLMAITLLPMVLLLGIIYANRYQTRRDEEFGAHLEVARATGLAFQGF